MSDLFNGVIDASVYPSLQAAADACFGPAASPHGRNYQLNKALYIPPGPTYTITAPIILTALMGGRIFGGGRFATSIQNVAGGPVFQTNGCAFTDFADMTLIGGHGAPCFDLDDTGGGTHGDALQGNEFRRIFFDGSQGATIGLRIAHTRGAMGSENKIEHCHFQQCLVAGASAEGWNAVQNTVIGGNVQGCGVGFWSGGGIFSYIASVGFQEQTGYDIQIDNANNWYAVTACRSESTNFISSSGHGVIDACSHSGPVNGTFLETRGGRLVVNAGVSGLGQVNAQLCARLRIQNSVFERPDWFTTYSLWTYANGNSQEADIDIENVQYGTHVKPIGQIRRRRVVGDVNGNPVVTDYDQ